MGTRKKFQGRERNLRTPSYLPMTLCLNGKIQTSTKFSEPADRGRLDLPTVFSSRVPELSTAYKSVGEYAQHSYRNADRCYCFVI